MRFLIQRVSRASVKVEGGITGEIGLGILILIGIAHSDTRSQADYLIDKVVHLRIFSDEHGRMNHNALDRKAQLLLVSQFTLYADITKGRRPSFDLAAGPAEAKELYDYIVGKAGMYGLRVQTGLFQAHMEVELVNDGPVTLLLEA